jgi:hypothetical protein
MISFYWIDSKLIHPPLNIHSQFTLCATLPISEKMLSSDSPNAKFAFGLIWSLFLQIPSDFWVWHVQLYSFLSHSCPWIPPSGIYKYNHISTAFLIISLPSLISSVLGIQCAWHVQKGYSSFTARGNLHTAVKGTLPDSVPLCFTLNLHHQETSVDSMALPSKHALNASHQLQPSLTPKSHSISYPSGILP